MDHEPQQYLSHLQIGGVLLSLGEIVSDALLANSSIQHLEHTLPSWTQASAPLLTRLSSICDLS
jgi:hypothetical protein